MSSTAERKSNSGKNKKRAPAATPLVVQLEQLRVATNAKARAGDPSGAIEILLGIIADQHRDNERLTRQLRASFRARFGRRSEKLTAEELGQLVLALGGNEHDAARANPVVPASKEEEESVDADTKGDSEDGTKPKKSKNGRHPGRTRLDPALKRNVTTHTVPEAERNCIHCGKGMQLIGHVDHERVEYVPARIEVAVERREKVACFDCRQDIVTAPRTCETRGARASDANDAMAPGAQVYRRAGASLLAHLLEAKCDDALPVYRQRQQLARLGFDVPLNTLYGYWDAASRLVQPVAQIVLSCVLGKATVGVDDTRLDWLDPDAKAKRRRGHLWCFVGDGGLVAFEFTKSWRADEVAPWIDAIDGYIQCADYAGYSALRPDPDGKKVPLVPRHRRLGCWMHLRRPFHVAFKAGERHAGIALAHIRDIYAVEREARDNQATLDERLVLRQSKSRPAAEALFAWIKSQKSAQRPSSYLGKALTYACEQEEFVMRCFSDGRFELDTGRVERQIREPVIGRKNYLFSGSADAARRLAGVYALVCSCQNLGIHTRTYLTDVITRLQAGHPLREINQLRPDIWAIERGALAADKLAQ